MKGSDDDWAHELSRCLYDKLIRRGWSTDKDRPLDMQYVFRPKRAKVYPEDCLENMPARVRELFLRLAALDLCSERHG